MFTFIGNIIACIAWGTIISVMLLIILHIVMKALYPSYSLSIPGACILFLLFIFLFAQSAMLTGAMYAKGYVDDIEVLAVSLIHETGHASKQLTSTEQTKEMIRKIEKEYPALSSYLSKIDTGTITGGGTAIAIALARNLKSEINYYILRRVLWLAGMMLTGRILLACTRRKQYAGHSADGERAFQEDFNF